MNIWKVYRSLKYHEKVPRKAKKKILGTKPGKTTLKLMLKSVKVLDSANTMYETPTILPYTFCPKCGCTSDYGTGNMVYYPEHWEYFKCLRCHNLVAMIDNSPYYHVLEFGPEFKFPY